MIDVCFLLEGTYPYVSGGVSTWVYDLIRKLHDKTFSAVYLGAHRSSVKKMNYAIPPNVIDFQEVYIFDYVVEKEPHARGNRKEAYEILKRFLLAIKRGDLSHFDELMRVVGDRETRLIDLADIAYSREGWEIIQSLYEAEDRPTSFLDYFWTWRFLYLPFFALLRTNLPLAGVYHCASTGYAGILGVMCKHRYHRPLILTEHGIYTRERKIEVAKADWIHTDNVEQLQVTEEKDFFKQWWIDIFSFFSRLTYHYADEIITIYQGNQKIQIEEGADSSKMSVIPNGVEVAAYDFLSKTKRKERSVFQVGFVGRIVPIKDVKTFIMACRRVYDEVKNVAFYLLGPTEEDEEYYRDCQLLVQMEGMGDVIHFMGKVDVREYYPNLDVIVLTSISEGQPIVILEAMACGVPIVASDVGACSELLYGSVPDDQLLGACGVITPICDAEATAQGVIKILRRPDLKKRMGEIGKKRVAAYYQMDDLIGNYQTLYTQYGEQLQWQA